MVFIVQTTVHLLVLFLFTNLITGLTAYGKDAVVNNHIGIPDDSRRPNHEEELPPYRSTHNPLRQRMEEEGRDLRSRDEYLRSYTQRKDKKAGLEDPGYPSSKEKVIGKDVEGANAATLTWAIEAVDAPRYFDWLSSRAIAVDAGNHPHIAYGGEHLYYAYHDGAAWHYETADTSPDVGYYASLALDTSGHAHIIYHDYANKFLKYATNASGSWVTTTVDNNGGVGFHSSIALDASGKAHISYHDYTNYDLKYATNASGSWVTTTVDNKYVYFYNSIAVDASGHAHITYADGNLGLRYATNASGAWIKTTVDSDEDAGRNTSLALDTKGKAHISYLDVYNTALKYATNESGSWVTTMVDNSGNVGYDTSLKLDSKDKVHISYNDEYNRPQVRHQQIRALGYGCGCNGWKRGLVYLPGLRRIGQGAHQLCWGWWGPLVCHRHPLPTAITRPATSITNISAKPNATVNANRLQTEAWFEWGTVSGGPYPNASPKMIFNGETNQKYSYKAQELTKRTTSDILTSGKLF
ncbi:MAG: exported protein of unknown function [Candidatus Brocadiaceae bacterium]|nr:exported protein of unknown function [Candidatus Brocadiaceae bacterium]